MDAVAEIEVLIRAKYSILYLVTWEEKRVEDAMAKLCGKLGRTLHTTFIDPFPQLLQSLISPDDAARSTIIARPLQEVDIDVFRQLEENDVLFIDSTHVGKVGSDVNRLLFEIFPVLMNACSRSLNLQISVRRRSRT